MKNIQAPAPVNTAPRPAPVPSDPRAPACHPLFAGPQNALATLTAWPPAVKIIKNDYTNKGVKS